MTTSQIGPLFVALAVGAIWALALQRLIPAAPPRLMRENVSGRMVPAVLGLPLVIGGLAGVVTLEFVAFGGWEEADIGAFGAAVALLLIVMGGVGHLDDRRGDEKARGLGGHLKALRSGRVTGGIVKLLVGLVAGPVAASLVTDGISLLLAGLIVALSANLLNLLDRAPGRAGKVGLASGVALALLAQGEWSLGAAGTLGAALACLVPDLRERAMLGDAGANALGAVLGLGLALSLTDGGRIVALVVLVVLNLASERWSFSGIIEETPLLHALDRLGRLRNQERTDSFGQSDRLEQK